MPVETELRLALEPTAFRALRAHPALKAVAAGRARRARIVTTYHDTADRRLREAGVALRVRRDGDRWEMSVKAADRGDAPGMAARPEIAWSSDGPAVDPMRLMTTPWRATFAKALRKGTLAPVFVTDLMRTSLPLRFPDGTTATLAIDHGTVARADAASLRASGAPIAEIELELGRGDARRLLELAHRLSADLPLAIESRSKAERGYALVDGLAARPVRADEIVHDGRATAATALATIVAACVRQVAANAVGFRGERLDDDEWVHQMRIGVRRLRSSLALANDIAPAGALDVVRGETRWVLDALGPARDLDVFAGETLPAAIADLERTRSGAIVPLRALRRASEGRRRGADDAARACVASPRFTRFVLAAADLAATLRAGSGSGRGAERATRLAERVLERRARGLAKAGDGLAHAGVEARHAVRIAAKKLRYATEFFATLYPRKRARAFRNALADLQDALGTFNDIALASRVAGVLAGPTGPATVAIEGWAAARSASIAGTIDVAWARYAKVRPFWLRD